MDLPFPGPTPCYQYSKNTLNVSRAILGRAFRCSVQAIFSFKFGIADFPGPRIVFFSPPGYVLSINITEED
jgi:hypothetical protein